MNRIQENDPYRIITIMSDTDFELLGFDEARRQDFGTQLHFQEDASFILRCVLAAEGNFTTNEIKKSPEFERIVGDVYPPHRFVTKFSDLRFTLNALGSTLIKEEGISKLKHYYRNPHYDVQDLR